MKEGKEILNLQRELFQLEGKKIIDLLLELDGTLYILEKNYDELLKIIVGYEEDDSIWDVENRKRFDIFFKELNRVLHNYLATIFTLIKHTERIKDKLKSEEFKEKYDIKLKSFKIDNFIKFIKDFRHLIQHKNLPPIQATLKIQPVDPNINIDTSNQSLVFNKKELLEWGDWKKNSRDFIEEYEYEEINLKDILQDYQKFIKEFYKWIRSTIKDKFSKELNEYNIIKNKIIELDKKIKSKIT